jgi:serine/threonine-protein kinase PknG
VAEGPSIPSDLFTVGRTLAVLLADFPDFTSTYQYTLPSPEEVPIFAQYESLYRFLLKSTAENPDDRFQSAEEMAGQLLGVLREVVATEMGVAQPAASSLLGEDVLVLLYQGNLKPIQADYHQIPLPLLDSNDPAFRSLQGVVSITDLPQRIAGIRRILSQYPDSREALLRLISALTDLHNPTGEVLTELEQLLTQAEEQDPWDWRVYWYWGRFWLSQGQFKIAQDAFDRVYTDLPGELAPKLALGIAAELNHEDTLAQKMYDRVSRLNPGYVSAVFGLARCLVKTGDRKGAVTALERVPQSSSLYVRSRVEIAQTLLREQESLPSLQEVRSAAQIVENLNLEGYDRYYLTRQVLETALNLLTTGQTDPHSNVQILGYRLEETPLRQGLEKTLRALAHLSTEADKIDLVDAANRIRPRTWF